LDLANKYGGILDIIQWDGAITTIIMGYTKKIGFHGIYPNKPGDDDDDESLR
jgi:hypothetical protein